MTDLSPTIEPKSDQLNADDLIAGPRTIIVRRVKADVAAADDQSVSIFFDGDNGKPYKPCKSMRRALVFVWGADGDAYVGRSMTLFRDPEVMFGGIKCGGIRISHMSHIEQARSFPLTATRGKKKMYSVQPLKRETQTSPPLVTTDCSENLSLERFASDDGDGFPGDVIPAPASGAQPKLWQEWGQKLRDALQDAASTDTARAIAKANRAGLDACPSAKLKAFILEPIGGVI